MSYEVRLKNMAAQPTLSIRGVTTFPALSQTIGEFLSEVWNHLEAMGTAPAGPPFTRYHGVDARGIDLEAGLPLLAPAADDGRIRAGELPGGEVISTDHIGPYDNLPDAGEALNAWLGANGRHAAGPNWEVYWTDPGSTRNSAEWRTEVLKPLAPAGEVG